MQKLKAHPQVARLIPLSLGDTFKGFRLVGTHVLRGFAAVLLLTAGLSVFIALWNAVRERRADLAMLRMLGASPQKVAGLVLCEALMLTGWIWLSSEWWVLAMGIAVAMVAALLPALNAYRMDVTTLLNSR